MKLRYLGFIFLICAVESMYAEQHILKVLSDTELRSEFAPFIDNVLGMVSPQDLFALTDEIVQQDQPQADLQLYEKLTNRIDEIKPHMVMMSLFATLQRQKKILGQQAQELLKPLNRVVGAVEIGTPGTYLATIKNFLTLDKDAYVVNDQQKLSDYVQAFSLSPSNQFLSYNHFVPLNNYECISEEAIPSSSVDLVICFIGLHHIPVEKLDGFVASIYRILRPGGVFILRDHDCHNEQLKSCIYAAHTTYNAIIAGESVKAESEEYRNFQPLQFWIDLLERHGFKAGIERLLQDGDPTCNTMIKFTKLARTEEEKLMQVSHGLRENEEYQRDFIQTRLTSPEWFNVDVSQAYGEFIEHTPFYEFPYFENILVYWKIFIKSWCAAARERGHLPVLLSSYTLMNLFIGFMMTIEYGAKGIISFPVRLLFSGEEATTIQVLVSDPCNEIEALDDRIKVIEDYKKYHLKRVQVPRYKAFLHIMSKLENRHIVVHEIAGQKKIQGKIRYKADVQDLCEEIEGCTQEYTWTLPTKQEHTYAAITIQVDKICDVMKKLKDREIKLLYLHDF